MEAVNSNDGGIKKKYRIYSPFAINVIKANFVYKGSFYMYIFSRILGVFITYYLWMAVYASSGSGILAGFSQSQMITYIFMSYVASNMVYINVATEVGHDVIDGSIAMNLIKPIDYRMKLLVTSLGMMVYRFIVPSMFMWVGIEIYRVCALGLAVTPVLRMVEFLLSCMFSFIIYFLFDFCFGMLAFYTTYVWGLMIIKMAVLNFLTGQLIPLAFFPDAVQKIFKFLPFSSMNYTPVMIYLGKMGNKGLMLAYGVQVIWIVILWTFSSYLWKHAIKRLIILGG